MPDVNSTATNARSGRAYLVLVALLFAALPAFAHDFWIEPSTFTPEVGQPLMLRLRVGQNYMGDPVARDPKLLEKFIQVDSKGTHEVAGLDGRDPAGIGRITVPGLALIGYRSRTSPLSLPAEKFEQYLRDEGLEKIIGARLRTGQQNADSHEVFSRCSKALVLAGPATKNDMIYKAVLGFTLELIPQKNPYLLSRKEALPVTLLYQGKPLEGALVVAINQQAPTNRISARTDRKGHVSMTLPMDGNWQIKSVHMIPAQPGTGAQWESLWASLTFNLHRSP
ncbi:MAG: DUF4198 domain-containing protein [Acidobacteriota bacterium]